MAEVWGAWGDSQSRMKKRKKERKRKQDQIDLYTPSIWKKKIPHRDLGLASVLSQWSRERFDGEN